MTKYSNRTCTKCGVIKPQPQMRQETISYTSGSSNTGLAKRTVAGALIGNKKSEKALGKWLLSPNKRTYKRTRKVWVCTKCHAGDSNWFAWVFWLMIIGLIILGNMG